MKPFDLYRMFQQNVYLLPFFSWMETTIVGTISMTIQIPFGSKLFINWGDGVTDSFTGTSSQIAISHTYSSSGQKYITASGTGFFDMALLVCLNFHSLLPIFYVSENKKLKTLVLSGNGLSSLDVTKNIEMSSFSCDYNNLTSLDVTKNIALAYFSCNGNSLTSLDVTKNININAIACIGNGIESLNISNNVKITTLNCDDNSLTSLDVSNNIILDHLYCPSNSLTSVSVNAILAALVANAKTNGVCNLSAQSTPAPPTGQGITDKATLISRGWTVVTD